MNWLRHELRLRAHKVGRAIQFTEQTMRQAKPILSISFKLPSKNATKLIIGFFKDTRMM
jgi:hypothetical protein